MKDITSGFLLLSIYMFQGSNESRKPQIWITGAGSMDLMLLNMQITTQRGPGLIPNFCQSLWPIQIIIKGKSLPPSFLHLLFSAVGFFHANNYMSLHGFFLPLFSTLSMVYDSHFLMESGTKRRKTLDSAAGIQTWCRTVGTSLGWNNSAHFFNAHDLGVISTSLQTPHSYWDITPGSITLPMKHNI